jgi:hypothetical protein
MSAKKTQLAFAMYLLLGCVPVYGQVPARDIPLHAALTPGEVLRYEIETSTSYSASVLEGYSTTMPLGPCQYSVGANITLKVGSVAEDGNIPVKAEYQDLKVTGWNCRDFEQKKLERTLHDFTGSGIVYQVGPHGEVGFPHTARDRFTYWSAADLLNKVTLDLLQARLADSPVSVGRSWKPHGQFTYWKDYLLSGLDVSAATMRWTSTPKVAGRDCASITSKYVFAPTDSVPSAITAGGTLRQQPTNVVAGVLDVSLLFDLQDRHIVWLNRSYKIENHVSVQPEQDPDPEVLTIRWLESGKARFISEKNSIEWMSGLKRFESSPVPNSVPRKPATGTGPSVAELTRVPVSKRTSAHAELDTLDVTPKGFSRWEREFCQSSWYCTHFSFALPGEVKIAEDLALQTVYLAKTSDSVVTIAVGPVIQRKYQGLRADEELRKQSEFFLANQLWMMNKPGIGLEAEDTSVDGYPARITTFRGQRRDLVSVQGSLVVLLSPWGESFPITCTVDQRDADRLRSTCERIFGLVRMRRPEQAAK